MSRFIFIQLDSETGRSNEVKVGHDTHTWMELQDEFFMFLQGCGFVIEREDIAEYWSEYLPATETSSEENYTTDTSFVFNDFGDGDIGDIDLGSIDISTGATGAVGDSGSAVFNTMADTLSSSYYGDQTITVTYKDNAR